ncbi:MAG: putative acetyltransferase [Thermoleophilia bacterium]|nr:putative acetyltransferase [Thermoleophilia bacterium]
MSADLVSPTYTDALDGVAPASLRGFFVGWPDPPTPQTHLRLLHSSYAAIVAIHDERVIGFVTAISDGVLSAYIPLLEVLPEFQGHGIGMELVRRMRDRLADLYMVDLLCDDDVAPFYERVGGFSPARGFSVRTYSMQSGAAHDS